jgi:hypothetical protein
MNKGLKVINYKDEKTIIPFYSRNCFLIIIFLIMIIMILGFLGFFLASLLTFINSFFSGLYLGSKKNVDTIIGELLVIEKEIKDATYFQNLDRIDLVTKSNNTIHSLTESVSGNIETVAIFKKTILLYKNKTIQDLEILNNLKMNKFTESDKIVYSTEYTELSTKIISQFKNVSTDLTSTISQGSIRNLALTSITFVLALLIIPLLLIALIMILVSQIIFMVKLKTLYSTKFKRVNELLFLDTFNNPSIFSKFMEYCKKEHSEENIYFWKDLQKYKEIKKEVDEEIYKKETMSIYKKYIEKDSEFELNISIEDREIIFSNLNSPNENIFENIENNIREVLLDIHKRFKESYLFNE